MRLQTVAALTVLVTAGPTAAQNVEVSKVDSVGCKSWETVKELIHFSAIGDKEMWKHEVMRNMVDGECALLNPGDRIVITDRGFASFRFRFDGKFEQYWVAK